jgi:glycosyltransferase involved in cell wall biosynthesis
VGFGEHCRVFVGNLWACVLAAAMKLSICIPTYNRYPFLKWTLRRLKQTFPEAEIIVSDNASIDFTQWSAGYITGDHQYIRQSMNIGAFPNMLAALSAAKGDYAVYCADDDYLLPAEVQKAIDYLESHPDVVAYCAPCEIWDEVNQKTFWNAFKVDTPRAYTLADGMDLFNFLIQSHIWPEHIVYRTPVPLHTRTRAYWAFADLVDILQAGALYFSDTPFYRNVLIHPVGERVQLGNVQCLTFFDEYRGGLEVLAHGLFGSELSYKARHQINEMISSFICARMHTAARLYARQGHIEEATMLLQRCSIANPSRDVTSLHAETARTANA